MDAPPSSANAGAGYIEYAASGALRASFGQLWQSHLPSTQAGSITVLPDGCVDIIWRAGTLLVVGPDRVAAHPHLPPGAHVLGLRFLPGQAHAALGVGLDQLVGQAVPLAEFTRTGVEALSQRIGSATPGERLRTLAAGMAGILDSSDALRSRQAAAVFDALRTGEAELDRLTARLALSPRTLRRLCQQQFGYGPKTLQRILRLQRFLHLSRRAPGQTLAGLAAAAGYADQSHLSRDARELTLLSAAVLRRNHGV
ncbi:helix-turn-helix domain-containing protein [Stenotrophomonas sp. C3(2023)]|uniref:helix-turn-helix domain-containing protein n=1 Tax=Stenotrophomonas sp. C3(2023) TaxID=3080277 RepID=UPI00293C88EF|nr:helix-turn-helix domain-containing protein [Stenotrophomonas sp. C3(2023)]MDV3468577.1 helix-turn-helix domain-containing protein [Stenotrophomonas sp. C3(2023)]